MKHKKVVVVGAARCGKTSVMRRWAENEFCDNEAPTLGVNVHIRHNVQCWDASGQPRFRELAQTYLASADAVMVMYSVANRASFDEAREVWLPAVRAATDTAPIYLVGTQLDLAQQNREVAVEDAVALAAQHDVRYSECSAKSAQGMGHLKLFIEQTTDGNAEAVEDELDAIMAEPPSLVQLPTSTKAKWFSCNCCFPCRRRYKVLTPE